MLYSQEYVETEGTSFLTLGYLSWVLCTCLRRLDFTVLWSKATCCA